MSEKVHDPTELDLFNLHIEFRDQAKLKREALDEESEVADEVRRKKSFIKYRTAQISLEYNTGKRTLKDEKDEDIKKPTVGALKSAVESDSELWKLEEELNSLQKKLDIASNYSSAISDKKYAIQGEIQLYLAQYFSEPVDFSRQSADHKRDYSKRAYIKEITKIKEDQEESDARKERVRRRKKEDD